MRSAKAPTISAQVMAAKVAWKAMKTYSGSLAAGVKVSARLSTVTPDRKSLSSEPRISAFAAEGQAVAVYRPQHGDQREHHQHLHQHREHVLGAHQAAVEQRQTGHRHEDYQQRRHQHPGHVALVDGGHDGRCGGRCCRSRFGNRRSRRCRRLVGGKRAAGDTDRQRGQQNSLYNVFIMLSLRGLPHRFRRCGCG